MNSLNFFFMYPERRKEAAKIKFGTVGIGPQQRNNSRPNGRPAKKTVTAKGRSTNSGKSQESSEEEGHKTYL